jgi:hypothetical protein
MKKLLVFSLLVATVAIFSYCGPSKKATSSGAGETAKKAATMYTGNVDGIVQATCSPCHFPPGGNKKPLNSFTAVRDNIDDIIRRIELNPTDKGFMPFKHAKLSQDTINVFKQWKADGMMEK